jgi:hypothetical protein
VTNSNRDYKGSGWLTEWEHARQAAKGFQQAKDIDRFALEHYRRFPKYPPDQFDRILWNHSELKRFYNQGSAKWTRADQAVSPNGVMTRLFDKLFIPTFITFPITELGFTVRDSSYKNYHDRVLLTEIKEALKEQITGSAWFSIEVSRKGVIHPHTVCEHDAFSFDAYSELVYEPRRLFKYLIKGIPYNAENLAVFFRAKKVLPQGKQLVRKTGTIRVPYSKN